MPRSVGGRRRNQFITIEMLSEAVEPDAAGQIDETPEANWVSILESWANIVPRGSREFFGADQAQADVTHQIQIPLTSESETITTQMRVRHRARTYNISSQPIDPTGNGAELIFNAIQVI